MRFLGIDYGTKTVGVAFSDHSGRIASPVAVLPAGAGLMEKLAELASAEQVGAFVIGLPLNMDGTEGPAAKRVRGFAAELEEYTGLAVHFQDERLSTFEADGKLARTGLTRKQKKDRRDAVAAAAILQAFLDSTGG